MYMSKEKFDGLKCPSNKKPMQGKVAGRIISDYMNAAYKDLKTCDGGSKVYNYNDLTDTYAAKIEMKNSGNEARVYSWVLDNNDNVLFVADYLQDTPDAYARTAALCGAFLDTFNAYMDINA